ncbi:CDP-glycerol glycerophosphotransferase family protein [Fusobacterium perfoetens]|uniref:CDP-glycerol glycerophosphotransferase family protein n=1 Tax=Fusobacterium perfoetens TaxID=852 RepID=UPI001F3C04D3|nr:CDP-glycerol glycerophosphotransferase family protein [Fusobacterium perfoetens]MCF2613241.1 CDP-glycerol glycerophosphotransferase family protein [Fusobacterium perfoetens]
MKNNIVLYMKEILKLFLILEFKIFSIFPLKDKKIVFCEGTNSKFSGNCRNIYEYLKEKKYSFYLVELQKKQNYNFIKNYNFYNLKGIYHLATAKYWFADSGFLSFLPKRNEQKNIQLWHGAGAFKKFGFAELRDKNIKYNKNKFKSIDLLSVSSDKIIDIYAEAFGIEREKIKNLGIPRADIFFKENEKLRVKEEFFNKYTNLKDKKIIMYAPTFRDNDKGNFNLKLDINLMKEKLEKLDYVLLLRLHPSIKKDNIQVDNKFSFNFGDYPQVSDLLIASDILISDYSSIIFEFSIMKKPILFYSYDVEEYIKDRGFYYNYYDFIPNKINYTTDEVVNSIINKEWDLERIEKFARYFFNPFDGNSTERVLKEVGLWEEEK